MRYTITGVFAAAATAAVAGIATANPWAIAFAGVTAGAGCGLLALNFFGELMDGFLRNRSYDSTKPSLAGYALGAALGIAAGLGINAVTQMDFSGATETTDPSSSHVQQAPQPKYNR